MKVAVSPTLMVVDAHAFFVCVQLRCATNSLALLLKKPQTYRETKRRGRNCNHRVAELSKGDIYRARKLNKSSNRNITFHKAIRFEDGRAAVINQGGNKHSMALALEAHRKKIALVVAYLDNKRAKREEKDITNGR